MDEQKIMEAWHSMMDDIESLIDEVKQLRKEVDSLKRSGPVISPPPGSDVQVTGQIPPTNSGVQCNQYSNQYTVFPLKEVYSFAKQKGGMFATIVYAIRDWHRFPEALRSYGYFVQVRRALCYIALQQHQLWDQFVLERFPTANSSSGRAIIAELENDFINNGLLAKHADTLPPETRTLRLSK